jgi:hypothetical protein
LLKVANAWRMCEKFIAALEIPPVDFPEAVVKMAFQSDIKKVKL